MIKISEMQAKDIVNIENGTRIGHVGDLDINLETGQVNAIVIGGTGKVMSFFSKEEEVVIPWANIVKIGEDVILVHIVK